MSDMSHLEMLRRPAESKMKPLEVEGVSAHAILEGQQVGVAEARQAREADHARRMEDLSNEIEQLTIEIAEQDNILTVTQASIEKSQRAISEQPGSPAALIHERVLTTSQREINNALAKKAELAGRKSAIEDVRQGLMS